MRLLLVWLINALALSMLILGRRVRAPAAGGTPRR